MKKNMIELLRIAASSLLISIAVKFFFHTYDLAPGGTTGLAIILSSAAGIPIQYVTLGISIPLLVLATVFLGKSFGFKTLFSVICTPVIMGYMPYIDLCPSIILSALLGGICVGAAIGNCLLCGAATGGTDTISLLLHKIFKGVSLRTIMFCVDGTVIVLSGIVSKDVKVAVFSLLSLLVVISIINRITKQEKKREKFI